MDFQLIKKYIKEEDINIKQLRRFEDMLVFWILTGTNSLTAMIFVFLRPGEDDLFMMSYLYCMLNLMQLTFWQRGSYCVFENNRMNNLFKKLVYVPIDLKNLFVAKIIRMFKMYMRYAMIVQVAVLVFHFLYNGFGFALVWATFTPVISGLLATLFNCGLVYCQYKDAAKQS